MEAKRDNIVIETKGYSSDSTCASPTTGYRSSDSEESEDYVAPPVPTTPPESVPDVSIGDLVSQPTIYTNIAKDEQAKFGDWIEGIIVGFSDDGMTAQLVIHVGGCETMTVDADARYLRKDGSILDTANTALTAREREGIRWANLLKKYHMKFKDRKAALKRRIEEQDNDLKVQISRLNAADRDMRTLEESAEERIILLQKRIKHLEEEDKSPASTDVDGSMENTLQIIRAQQPYIDSLLQINAYRDHNSAMKQDMRERLIVLDHKYGKYANIINGIQISIIVLSAMTAFVQASSNTTQISDAAVGFITLCVATYTSLLLAISKYMKYDEKKEAIHNLQQQFASFIVKLETRDDRLNTWCSDSFWAGHPIEKKREEWIDMEGTLKQEFGPLIEDKANLCCEFEKGMDSEEQKQLAMNARTRSLNIRLQKNDLMEKEIAAVTQANILKTKMKEVEGKKKKTPSGTTGYAAQPVLRAAAMNAFTTPAGAIPQDVGGCALCQLAFAKKNEKLCQECLDATAITVGKKVTVQKGGANSKAKVTGIDVEAGTCTVEYLDASVGAMPARVSISDIAVEISSR